MPIQPARLIKARPYQKWWKWIVPCELLAVTTVVGNRVANSLEPKKLTTKVRVAMKVSPCLNWLLEILATCSWNYGHVYFAIVAQHCGLVDCRDGGLRQRRVLVAMGYSRPTSVRVEPRLVVAPLWSRGLSVEDSECGICSLTVG